MIKKYHMSPGSPLCRPHIYFWTKKDIHRRFRLIVDVSQIYCLHLQGQA